MQKIVWIRFRPRGKLYAFDPVDLELKKSDQVIVQTEYGLALGEVSDTPGSYIPNKALAKVVRPATPADIAQAEKMLARERIAYDFCMERIKERNLPMNMVSVDAFFDGSKIIFFFTAEGRIDFRELVKDLVHRFHTRVEMRQIGVRNQAKMVGGLGNCGRELCCATFLNTFDPISIKMAKEQNLSLNPSKISGACGRLMCCLTYEYSTYLDAKKGLPKFGKKINTPLGMGKVIRLNVLAGKITVELESGKEAEFSEEQLATALEPEVAVKPDKPEKPEKSEKPAKPEKQEKPEKPEKSEKEERKPVKKREDK
ncbi:MAG: stage 0 sporulation family protein [Deltaproteobacteria bacterium]|nr:stage 0 sporulation family protein [Deltaproteobacteria bacterium]